MSQAVVVRNTFLEVGGEESHVLDTFRRQVSEPVKMFSSLPEPDQGEETDEDFGPKAVSGLRADAPAFESAQASQLQPGPEGYVQSGKQRQGGKGGRQSREVQAWNRDNQYRDAPKRSRDGQLSRLKDEDITHLEPPWETVTTVMMRNLPNKYTQQMLLGELRDAGFHMQEDFDFFYLPMDHSNCANLGYCFINFTRPQRANDFAAAFSGKRMRRFNSHKTAVIMPASIQGYEQNYTYYISTRVAQAADPQYRPLFLRPLPSIEMVPPNGKGKGRGDRGKDGGRGRRSRGDWNEGALGGDWGKDDGDRVVPPQIPAAPQDYQVMCAACGTVCGSNYRFCSFCGNFLCDGMGGPVMMAYFQPSDWQMMEQPAVQNQEPQKPATNIKETRNKMPSEETSEATEELDILHGRMMLLAALKVAGSQGS